MSERKVSERNVLCKKLQKELPGLEKPPFPGDVGQQIYDNVSAEAWTMWKDDIQLKIINEYRLNMGNPKDYEALMKQMMVFLGLESAPT